MKIFLVIPVYNEETRLEKVIREVKKYKYPVVVIDDGSTDKSFKIAKGLGVYLLKHKVNLGKGAAMKTGAEYAFSKGANAVIFMDSDGQHDSRDLNKFVKLLKNNDFVVGSRTWEYGIPLIRYLGNKFASVVVSILYGPYITDLLCGYRGIKKAIYKKIVWESAGYGVETEMIIRAALNGIKVKEVNVETTYKDKYKGVTILDAINILFDVVRWRIESWL